MLKLVAQMKIRNGEQQASFPSAAQKPPEGNTPAATNNRAPFTGSNRHGTLMDLESPAFKKRLFAPVQKPDVMSRVPRMAQTTACPNRAANPSAAAVPVLISPGFSDFGPRTGAHAPCRLRMPCETSITTDNYRPEPGAAQGFRDSVYRRA